MTKRKKRVKKKERDRIDFIPSFFTLLSSLHLASTVVNFLPLKLSIPPSTCPFLPPSPSINLFLPRLPLSLQLSQCNVNDVPSIAPDSARTLTSSPPPLLHRPVISLSSSHPSSSPLLRLTSFISLSLPLYVSPSPTASHTCHLSSLPLPSFLSPAIIYVSLSLLPLFFGSLSSSSSCAVFYLPVSSSLPPSFSLSLPSIFLLLARLKGTRTTAEGSDGRCRLSPMA